MCKGEVREIPNEELAEELIKASFIKVYKPDNIKELKQELENANSKIVELEKTIEELNAELEKLNNSTSVDKAKNSPDNTLTNK